MEKVFDEIVLELELNYINPSSQIFQWSRGAIEITDNINILPSSITINIDKIRFEIAITLQCFENEILGFAIFFLF